MGATREENAGLVLNANTNRYTRVSDLASKPIHDYARTIFSLPTTKGKPIKEASLSSPTKIESLTVEEEKHRGIDL